MSGLTNKKIEKALDYLDSEGIAMHSMLAVHSDNLLAEVYYEPFKRESLHRMYSVTKSINAIGIGILLKKGLISLDDEIIKYFPKYDTPALDSRVREATIRNLLMMKSPFVITVYKRGAKVSNDCSQFHKDWINSYFTLEADHQAGTFFSYDTGASVVLAKIIENVSSLSYMDFMKKELFMPLGLSDTSYILSDPSGNPQGGSGLMMNSLDLLKIINALCLGGKGLVDEDYLKDATSALSDTFMTGLSNIKERRAGYGYQIWRTSDDTFAFVGLGGQYAVANPERKISLVTTADTQINESQSGVILKTLISLSRELDPKDEKIAAKERSVISLNSKGKVLPYSGHYRFKENKEGYDDMYLSFKAEEGLIEINRKEAKYKIEFAIGKNKECGIWEKSSSPALTSASFNADGTLSIWSQFIGEYNGGLTFEIASRDSGKTLSMRIRQYGELMFSALGGVFTLERVE